MRDPAPITAASTGGAQANNCTLAAAAGKFTYITAFEVTGLGATSVGVVTVTLTGALGGTLTWKLPIPAGVTVGITPLIVSFSPPLPSSAVNTALVVNVPTFGAGNTDAAAVARGFQE